jgi:hypothetical protein
MRLQEFLPVGGGNVQPRVEPVKIEKVGRTWRKSEYWWINSKGYVEGRVWTDGVRRRVRQHRWVMENHLGRMLNRWESVHHKDGNPLNNDITNLEVIDHVEHAYLHNKERRESNGWNPAPHNVIRVQRQSEERRARRESQNI